MGAAIGKPSSVEEYLAALPDDKRVTLERLRETIRVAAPMATEGISYAVPAFKHHGPLVSYAAFKDHCSFFPMSPVVLQAHRDELEGFDISKGTIRFPIGESLPAAVVTKIVEARIEENEARHDR